MPKAPGNSKYVKKLNRMNILNILKKCDTVSRQQLADITGLTPPAISGIIKELIKTGFVKEIGLDKSRGGRRPVMLKFVPNAGYVIGIEITRYEIIIGISDLKNPPTDIQTLELDMTDPDEAIPQLIEVIKKVMYEDHSEKNFMAVGIAFPGLLTEKNSSVKRSVNLGIKWNNYPIKRKIQEGLGDIAIFIENNSNASALAEKWFGEAKFCKDLVYINLGEGISAGIIIEDKILQGFHGHAGEIGHIVVTENGPLCNCGNRGCLESLYGIPAIIRKAYSELPLIKDDDPLKKLWKQKGKVNIEDIINFARVEGSYSKEIFSQMAKYVGIVIADVINLFNPQSVFLGGKMALAADEYMDVLLDSVKMHAFPEIASSTEVKISSLGGTSGVFGGCALALREIFKSHSNLLDDAILTSS